MSAIAIVDYGLCNVRSIANMLRKAGHDAVITSDPDMVAKASKLILPGVGSFDEGVKALENKGLREILDRKALVEKAPILGICLGAQLMTRTSEEGVRSGLGWLPAETVRFSLDTGPSKLKTPHMGWNYIRLPRSHAIFENLPPAPRFYFLHSYHFQTSEARLPISETDYGRSFASGLGQDNLIALQFHPEKSHRFGYCIMDNFARIQTFDS